MNNDFRKTVFYTLKSPKTKHTQSTVPRPAPVVVVLPSGRPGRKSREAWADRHTRPSGEGTVSTYSSDYKTQHFKVALESIFLEKSIPTCVFIYCSSFGKDSRNL